MKKSILLISFLVVALAATAAALLNASEFQPSVCQQEKIESVVGCEDGVCVGRLERGDLVAWKKGMAEVGDKIEACLEGRRKL